MQAHQIVVPAWGGYGVARCGPRFRDIRPRQSDRCLCVVTPDRGERQAAFLCGVAPRAGYGASGSGAGGYRGGTEGKRMRCTVSSSGIVALSIAASISACATQTAPALNEQEKTEVGVAWIACLHSAARKIDDRKSDASTIALAIRPLCAAEAARYWEAGASHLSPRARRAYMERVASRDFGPEIRAVLAERAKP